MVAVNSQMMSLTLSELRHEVARLRQQRLQLAKRLSDAAEQLDFPGIAPASSLIVDLRTYRQQLFSLLSTLHGEAKSSGQATTLNDLEDLIEARDYRKITTSVLEQLSGLFHVDIPDFAPLALCHQEATRLCGMADGNLALAPDSELESLRNRRHPLNSLVRLCDEAEHLSDIDWTRCHDDVATTYGRLLATALTRGRIRRRSAVEESPVATKSSSRPQPGSGPAPSQSSATDSSSTIAAAGVYESESPPQHEVSDSIFELAPAIRTNFDISSAGPTSAVKLRQATLQLEVVQTRIHPAPQPATPVVVATAVESTPTSDADNQAKEGNTGTVKSTTEYVVQLISDGRLPLALQLARCLESRSESPSPVPTWLLRALILGRHLSYSKGEIARQLDEELKEFRSDSLGEGSDEQQLAMSYLLRAAALPAALLAGSAPAPGILRSFKIAPGFSQLYNYCSRIAQYGDRLSGSLVEMFRPSGTIAGASELEAISQSTRAWLMDAARSAVSYSRTSPLFLHAHWTLTAGTAIRHTEASVLWCKWQETLSLAQRLLKPVCELADGERNWVRQEISRLSSQVRVEPLEHSPKAQGQSRPGTREIVLPSEEMQAVILEAVAIANRWLCLSHKASAANVSPLPLEALELRDEIIKRSEGVLSEMAQHRQSNESPLVKAAITCCQSAVRQILALFESRIFLPLVEPDPRQILNLDLLKIPGIDLNDQWQPESEPAVIERALITSLAQPEPTWRQCYDFHARAGNHSATERLLRLDVWTDPAEKDSLRLLRDRQIVGGRSALKADLNEVSSELSAIAVAGIWTADVLTSFQKRLDRLRDELPLALNFSAFNRQVHQLQAAIVRQSSSSWVPSALAGWQMKQGPSQNSLKPAPAGVNVVSHSCDIFSGE